MCLFSTKQESNILMLLNFFLPFFMFFSLLTWVFANPCEEMFSSSSNIFISFMKKQMKQLLLVDPTHLKNTINILENYIGEVGIALLLRMGIYKRHQI